MEISILKIRDVAYEIFRKLTSEELYACFQVSRQFRKCVWNFKYQQFRKQINDPVEFKKLLLAHKLNNELNPNILEVYDQAPNFKGDIYRLATDYFFWDLMVPGWSLRHLTDCEHEFWSVLKFDKFCNTDLLISELGLHPDKLNSTQSEEKEFQDKFYYRCLEIPIKFWRTNNCHSSSHIYLHPLRGIDHENRSRVDFTISAGKFCFGERLPKHLNLRYANNKILWVRKSLPNHRLTAQEFGIICHKFSLNISDTLDILNNLTPSFIFKTKIITKFRNYLSHHASGYIQNTKFWGLKVYRPEFSIKEEKAFNKILDEYLNIDIPDDDLIFDENYETSEEESKVIFDDEDILIENNGENNVDESFSKFYIEE